jgi:hypothetical protein
MWMCDGCRSAADATAVQAAVRTAPAAANPSGAAIRAGHAAAGGLLHQRRKVVSLRIQAGSAWLLRLGACCRYAECERSDGQSESNFLHETFLSS